MARLDLGGQHGVAGQRCLGLGHVGGEVALERFSAGVGADGEPAAVVVAGRVGFDERRLLDAATVLRVRAAGRELAADAAG